MFSTPAFSSEFPRCLARTAAALAGAAWLLAGSVAAQTQSEIDRLGREFEKKREAIDKELAKRREATLGPVIREYVSRMQRLAGDATRAGKLTEALAAREAVAKVMVPGQWRLESGGNGVSGEAELHEDGRISGLPVQASWRVEGGQLVVKWNDGSLYKYELPAVWENTRALKGHAYKDAMPVWETRLGRR
jgi:hypothetical protein